MWFCVMSVLIFFFSSRRRHTRCALVTGVQTCALPICGNAHYIRAADDARLAALVAPRIAALLDRPLTDSDRQLLLRSIPELKPRAKDLNELAESALYLFRIRPLNLEIGRASCRERVCQYV